MRKLFGFGFRVTAHATSPSSSVSSTKSSMICGRLMRFRPTAARSNAIVVGYKKMSTSTSSSSSPQPETEEKMKGISALFLLFPNFNTLDLNGPLETLAQAKGYSVFNTTIASATELTTAAESLIVKRHISFKEAKHRLSSYDVLIVPGAPGPDVLAAIDSQPDMLDIITSYSKLTTQSSSPSDLDVVESAEKSQRKERILMSVCTGAGFLGTTGVLAGKKATTHWGFLNQLKNLTDAYAGKDPRKKTEVVEGRFVDAGLNKHGVRIISAAGVSSGIDASLYLVSKKVGMDAANTSAHIMDYRWRLNEGIIVQ